MESQILGLENRLLELSGFYIHGAANAVQNIIGCSELYEQENSRKKNEVGRCREDILKNYGLLAVGVNKYRNIDLSKSSFNTLKEGIAAVDSVGHDIHLFLTKQMSAAEFCKKTLDNYKIFSKVFKPVSDECDRCYAELMNKEGYTKGRYEKLIKRAKTLDTRINLMKLKPLRTR